MFWKFIMDRNVQYFQQLLNRKFFQTTQFYDIEAWCRPCIKFLPQVVVVGEGGW